MVDEFENSVVPFKGELPEHIKTLINQQLNNVQGSTENLEGFNRAKFILQAQQLTGLELKRLRNYIDSLPKDEQGRITDPAYLMIGGDALNTFIQTETERLRHQINTAAENQESLGKTEKQDIKPPKPPDFEAATGIPKLGLLFEQELTKIKHLITY